MARWLAEACALGHAEAMADDGPSERERPEPFDVTRTFVHLGLGATARLLPDFSWSEEYLDSYGADSEPDGDEGRLVSVLAHAKDWEGWERHPAGEELVVVLSGRVRVIHDIAGTESASVLGPLEAIVNPPGLWHTADVLEEGMALYVTPGRGTEHRPREPR